MDTLTAVLAILVAIAILFEVARRLGVPFPTLFVLGGLGLAFVPGLPRIALEPELVLLVFLPPLLFTAAVDSPIRELRANLAPLVRLSIGLVVFTMVIVAVVAYTARADHGLGRGLRPRGDRRADRRTGSHQRLPPDRRATPHRDAGRRRSPVQRRDRARRLSRGGARCRQRQLRPVRGARRASWSQP